MHAFDTHYFFPDFGVILFTISLCVYQGIYCTIDAAFVQMEHKEKGVQNIEVSESSE